MGEDLLELTAELVNIPSESHGEALITDWIESRLRNGSPWLTIDRVGENLVARTNGGKSLRLIIAGHTDTVPANGNEHARIDNDVLWGLGSTDMKSGLAVMLALAATIAEPAVDVTYVFYECEEVEARFNGLRRLFLERPDLLVGDAALLGEPTDGAIEAGCQGTMRVEVRFAGVRAHTARPWMGVNAIHRAGAALARLASYEGRRPIVDGCEYREAMQAVRVEGGVAGNVVPDRAVLTVNHRFAPDRTCEQAEAHLREVLASDLDLTGGDAFDILDVAPGAAPGLTHPLLRTLIARNMLPVRAKLGWTDVARFAERGIPAANFGPGDATLAHTAGERVERDRIDTVFSVLDDLLRRGLG